MPKKKPAPNPETEADPSTQIATIEERGLTAAAAQSNLDLWLDEERFNHIWRIAQCFAESDLVPKDLRSKPHDCFILTQLAFSLRVDPFRMMQHTYVVHGKPGMEASMQIGLLNASGRIHGQIRFEFTGDKGTESYGCTAVVEDAETGKEVRGPKVDWAVVKKEGWLSKNGSKWQTIPDLMFRYRAAAWLIRSQYPEVTLGLQTREELDDVYDVEAKPVLTVSGETASALAGLLEEDGEPTTQDTVEADVPTQPADPPPEEEQAKRRRSRCKKCTKLHFPEEGCPNEETKPKPSSTDQPDQLLDPTGEPYPEEVQDIYDWACKRLRECRSQDEITFTNAQLNADESYRSLPEHVMNLVVKVGEARWNELKGS